MQNSASSVTSNAGPDLSDRRTTTARTIPATVEEDSSSPHRLGPQHSGSTGLALRSEATPRVGENTHDDEVITPGELGNSPEEGGRNARVRHKKGGKKTKAHMRISSLNIKGRTSIDNEEGTQEKVNQIPNMMRNRRIGMLALQETHYTEDYVAEVTARFGDTIHIEYSRPVGRRASRAEGVALVFYKPTTNVLGLEKREVIPGRSMIVASQWHGEDVLKTMVGYAPNAAKENKEFWQTNEKFIDEYPEWTPDAVCIDANLVPEAIDRLPAHEDDQEAVAAMKSFLRKCDLVDGWREENPGEPRFTFTQETDCPSHSRLDRIYLKRSRIAQSRSWDMELTKIDGIKTDHKRVSCEITTAEAPEQGHGRYTAPLYVAKTLKMVQLVDKTGKELMNKMMLAAGEQRTEEVNPQTLYAKWKRTTGDELRREAKTIIPRAKKKISELQEKL
ncbi:DNase I-like protein, partial [Hymenopellis radicata]